MSSVWERIRDWFGGADDDERGAASDLEPVDLVVALRQAADDVHAVGGEIEQVAVGRPGAALTQARLLVAGASVLEIIADGITKGVVGAEGESTEGWRARHAVALYRELLALLERARLAIARPPESLEPVKVGVLLLRGELVAKADAGELMAIGDRLQERFAPDITRARATRAGAEQARLNELLGLVRARANVAESLLYRRITAGTGSEQQGRLGRAAFGEIHALWLLVAQELVEPDITAALALGPESGATDKYRGDNVWLMTDPVARARYRREGREADLEQDIRYEVLRGRPFSAEDVACAQQLDWLEQTGVVKRLASYWAASPHQPIYRALQSGQLALPGGAVPFTKGDCLVWLCQMGRELASTDRPVLIGDLQSAAARRLCGDMRNAMMGARMKRQAGGSGMS